MLDLLSHRADVGLELDALFVSHHNDPPIRCKLLVELLEALLQSVQEASLLRELLFESFYFGVHRRQLLERADMLTGAQPFFSYSKARCGPTWVRTRTRPVMNRGL